MVQIDVTRMGSNFSRIILLGSLGIILSSCLVSRYDLLDNISDSSPSEQESTLDPNSKPMETVTILETITASATFVPSPTFKFEGQQILEIEFDESNEKRIATAFWSDNGQIVYYGLQDSSIEFVRNWYAYDVGSHTTTELAGPPFSQVWFPHGYYPELETKYSPSGRYELQIIPDEGSTDGLSKVILIDTANQDQTVLLEFGFGNIFSVDWSSNETVVIFDISYEGPSLLYYATVTGGTARPLSEIATDHSGLANFPWAMSPDGSTLAIIDDSATQLQLIPLKSAEGSKHIGEFGHSPQWSPDSKLVYFWGSSEFDRSFLQVYNTGTDSTSTLFSLEELQENGICLTLCQFRVSPNGDQILFWWGVSDYHIWIVEVN